MVAMNDTTSDFDTFVAELRRVFFALRAESADLLSDLELTGPERSLLQELEAGGKPVPELAQARAVSRQAMQKLVDRLAARELVTLEPNPRHQRSPLVTLTTAGKRLSSTVRTRERKALAAAELPLSAAELRKTTKSLAALAAFFEARR